jgi:hypothetical protein
MSPRAGVLGWRDAQRQSSASRPRCTLATVAAVHRGPERDPTGLLAGPPDRPGDGHASVRRLRTHIVIAGLRRRRSAKTGRRGGSGAIARGRAITQVRVPVGEQIRNVRICPQ